MSTFKFTKMHGLGNDFVVIDGVNQTISLGSAEIRSLCDRRLGVGCDQVLIVSPATRGGDFTYTIFNADGSRAGHCGNGARCLAIFIHEKGLSLKKKLILEIDQKNIDTTMHDNHTVTVMMGQAEIFDDFLVDNYLFTPVDIGNAHVITREEIPQDLFLTIAQNFQTDTRFHGVNVSMMRGVGEHDIDVKTFERGVGLTPACGSAATACAFLAISKNFARSPITVHMQGGDVVVHCQDNQLTLTEPAITVYEGVWHAG